MSTITKRLELLEKNLDCKFDDTYDLTIPFKEFSKNLSLHDQLGQGSILKKMIFFNYYTVTVLQSVSRESRLFDQL